MTDILISLSSPSFAKGNRCILLTGKGKWQLGTVLSLGKTSVMVMLDVGIAKVVGPLNLKNLKLVPLDTKKNKRVLSDLQAKALYENAQAKAPAPIKPTLTEVVPAAVPEVVVKEANPKDVFSETPEELAELLSRSKTIGQRVVCRTEPGVWYAATIVKVVDDKYALVVFDSQKTFPGVLKLTVAKHAMAKPIFSKKRMFKAMSDAEAAALQVPDYTNLVGHIEELTDHYADLTPTTLGVLLDDIVREARIYDIAIRPKGSSILHRSVPLTATKLKTAIRTKIIRFNAGKLSLWTGRAPNSGKYLNGFSFGVVVDWNPPEPAVILDLAAVMKKIMSNSEAVSKLGDANKQKKFIELAGRVSAANELILRSAPLQSPVSGVVSSSTKFRKQCSLLGLPSDNGPNGSLYVRLYDLQSNLEDLGLV